MARVAEEPSSSDTIAGIVDGAGEGRRAFNRIVWSLGILAVLAFFLALLKPVLWPPSLAERAEKIMSLPVDATVVRVSDSKTRQVWFTLPESKGPGSRRSEVWTLNGFPAPPLVGRHARITPPPSVAATGRPAVVSVASAGMPSATKVGARKFSISYGEQGGVSLEYDEKTHRYHFQTTELP